MRRRLLTLSRAIPDVDPRDLDASDILPWAAAQNWSRETRYSYYSTLRGFLTWLDTAYPRPQGPREELPTITRPHGVPRPAPNDVVRLVIGHPDARIALAGRLAGQAGLRRTEITLVHENDLVEDLFGLSLLVHGKGGKTRLVPLSETLTAAMQRYRDQLSIHGWFFPGAIDGHLSSAWLGTLVSRALPAPWTLHSLRHRFATDVFARTGNLILVQQLLGHSSVATTQRYVAIPDNLARRAVNLIAA